MKQYEFTARTESEAIEQGLQELGVSIGDVDVRVVEEGSKGLFGLFGSRPAKVLLTVKEAEEDPLGDLITEEKKPERKPERKPAEKKQPEKKADRQPAPKKEEKAPAVKAEKPEKQDKPEKAEKAEKPARAEKPAKHEKPAAPQADAPAGESDGAEDKAEKAEKQELRRLEKPEITAIPEDQLDPESPAGIAHAFLKELTRMMGVDVTIEMGTDAEGNVYGSMTGDTLGILIGRRGETLDAVQYLTSLKVNRGREEYTRVTLDTEHYRAKREDTLIRLANRMANRAVRTGRRVSLEPMNPYERRIIHFALQQHEGVTTHSEGDEPNRHVVITLKK